MFPHQSWVWTICGQSWVRCENLSHFTVSQGKLWLWISVCGSVKLSTSKAWWEKSQNLIYGRTQCLYDNASMSLWQELTNCQFPNICVKMIITHQADFSSSVLLISFFFPHSGSNLFFRASSLLRMGIKLVFVMEGEAPKIKAETMSKRTGMGFRGRKTKSVPKPAAAATNTSRGRFKAVLREVT